MRKFGSISTNPFLWTAFVTNLKAIIELVHHDFVQQSEEADIQINYENINQTTLIEACNQGAVPIVLISTYRMDRKKTPHWVVISGYDEQCFICMIRIPTKTSGFV